ncbi:MAG: 2-amino-4-hydroxy-6-hydroxymethyldihydropteridine diphosphokinase [Chitinophaga sp.]|jgi:2-amino-4-hydroxy-6-hydroxymethyldihydropteridine diphosphokinase|nr:2-amino-4-hydroxy-6-hydroxymethyldihydropteridine diphosphokinase [Chitinophaga sp.]
MQTAYLLIGGNLGNIQQNLHTAIDFINKECGTIVKQSSIYKTAAWGLTEQPDFLNQVLVLQTDLVPEKLMHQLLLIEEKMGRLRTIKLGPRIIDIDILLIDDLVLTSDLLTVPHPALPQRRFALAPLNEVAAHVIHPVKKKTIHTLLLNCTDSLDVQKISASA